MRGLLLCVAGLLAGAQAPAQPVVVTLRPGAVVNQAEVTIEAIASVEGGDALLRQAIANLDVAEIAKVGRAVAVSREQVSFRIQLAGFDVNCFRVEGPNSVMVKMTTCEFTQQEILRVARQALLQRFQGKAKEEEIRLLEPVRMPVLQLRPDDPLRLVGEIAPGTSIAGRVRVDVIAYVGGQRRAVVPVMLEVGRASQGGMDIPATEDQMLIHVRDNVKLVAIVGNLRLTVGGEALQDGRIGQLIRVRNTDSGKIVVGRVAAAGTVEVDY